MLAGRAGPSIVAMTITIPSLELIDASHPDFGDLCRLHNGMHTPRPKLIARCSSPVDVAAALDHARAEGLPVSVRGGRHHVAGYAIVDGGLVIDTSPMKRIDLDPNARTVRVGAGVLWGELDAATQAYGLAVTGGRDSTTGVVGQALGSGSGWLERRFGLTGDNVLAAELVTADGRSVRASADTEPELFWGLRGAGGNFGVITALELRLHPVGPVVYGGMLMFAGRDRAAILRNWRDVMDAAPDELGAAIALITAPPLPFLPEAVHGRPAVGVFVCWSGDPAEGEAACAPLRELGARAVDLLGPTPYTEAQKLIEPTVPWGLRAYWKAENVRALSDDAIAALVAAHDDCPAPMTQVVIEPKGRAIARVPEDATALGGRAAAFTWMAFSAWEEAEDDAMNIAWTRDLARSMEPFGMPLIAPNFLDGDEVARRERAFGAAKFARLRALKRVWDPDNVFRSCANIAP
jgi:FAD/FMN-containing dehydrogenase